MAVLCAVGAPPRVTLATTKTSNSRASGQAFAESSGGIARPQAEQLKQSSSSSCSSSGAGLAGEGALGVELREGGEEGAEEAHRGVDIGHPDRLADGMHAERGHPQVDDAQPCLGGDDWSDGGAAGAVVPHHELLHSEARPPRQLAHEEAALCVRGVALVVVGLDDHAAVELGCVCRVVLLGIVGVHRVRHVRGQKEAPARRDEQSLGGGVRRVRCEAGGDALQRLAHDGAARARE
mmetsp:Transcript_21000/g.49727  ORF Transcript_21000/g.49727 Transcript_21000/m.49727 type:complete len:236 (-) Transcript_21000:364-1071(-)